MVEHQVRTTPDAPGERPSRIDMLRMVRAWSRGSAIDPPRSFLRALLDMRALTAADSPMSLKEANAALRDYRIPKLSRGDMATDFELRRLDAPEQTVRLSQFRGEKPVALVLGSFSCPPFRVNLEAVNRLYAEYADRLAFFLVYIREAHPENGWVLTWNRKVGVSVQDPTTFDERAVLATTCVQRMSVAMPVLVDDPDNPVARIYGGWPIRFWIVGRDGRVAYRANEGPFGFKPTEFRAAIEATLSANARAAPAIPSA